MATKKKTDLALQPLADRVVIEPLGEGDKEKRSASGIIIPMGDKDERVDRGIVLAVGEGRTDKDGKLVKMKVKKGDKVLFQWGDKVSIDEREYFIVSETSILAVIK